MAAVDIRARAGCRSGGGRWLIPKATGFTVAECKLVAPSDPAGR